MNSYLKCCLLPPTSLSSWFNFLPGFFNHFFYPAGWILPSDTRFSSAILAVSLRMGSKEERMTASGVSSIIRSTPQSGFKGSNITSFSTNNTAFHFIIGQRNYRYGGLWYYISCTFLNSQGNDILCFFLSASSRAWPSMLRIIIAVSWRICCSTFLNSSCFASSVVKPERRSNS